MLFTPISLGNSKWALKGSNGKFLKRCPTCLGGTNSDYINLDGTDSSQPTAQWTILEAFPIGTIALQCADVGKFLAYCANCGPSTSTYSAAVNGVAAGSNYWYSEAVGDKIVLRSNVGYYLQICPTCWTQGGYATQKTTFVNGLDKNAAEAQWKPVNLKNGAWGFQGSNGQYLTRCAGCVTGGTADFAFSHVNQPDGGWSQWKLTRLCE